MGFYFLFLFSSLPYLRLSSPEQMPGKTHTKNNRLNRRRFLSNTIKLAVLGSLLPAAACKNKSAKNDTTIHKKTARGSKRKRQKWSHEGLVMNSKTKVMHLPTSKVYVYYDEIIPKHLSAVSLVGWAAQLQEPVRLNKEQSGNILEILSLRELQAGVNDQNLVAATDTLSKAFTPACDNKKGENANLYNFRLHELMLQLLALNSSVPDKWQAFNSKVKKPVTLRKRQKWMETETAFNERVNYIVTRQTEYLNRLTERARKYSFT